MVQTARPDLLYPSTRCDRQPVNGKCMYSVSPKILHPVWNLVRNSRQLGHSFSEKLTGVKFFWLLVCQTLELIITDRDFITPTVLIFSPPGTFTVLHCPPCLFSALFLYAVFGWCCVRSTFVNPNWFRLITGGLKPTCFGEITSDYQLPHLPFCANVCSLSHCIPFVVRCDGFITLQV